MPMYMSTMPWPSVYHGLSWPRYCVTRHELNGRGAVRVRAHGLTTFDETAPLRLPLEGRKVSTGRRLVCGRATDKPMTMASVTPRLYDPSTLFETQALSGSCQRLQITEKKKAETDMVFANGRRSFSRQ
jgi:hypothetical protein